jgi:uncharacterized membrane protein
MQSYSAQRDRTAERLAIGLGWFSIGLGVAEVAAPGRVARLIGIAPDDRAMTALRALGAREIGHGLAILTQPSSAARVWSRVAGDALDLGYLGVAFRDERTNRARLSAAVGSVLGVAALDLITAQRLGRAANGESASRHSTRGVRVQKTLTVNKPVEQVYEFWRDFEQFPRFMAHVVSVERTGEGRWRWRAKGPAGLTFSWEAEIVEDRPGELLSWRSLPGSSVRNRGVVHFQHAPGARGTEVRVELEYEPPAGQIGKAVAWLFGEEPEQQLRDDLRRFKQLMETGEIPLSDGPGLWRPAQPAKRPEDIRSLGGVKS